MSGATPARPRLAVVILTYNEAPNIAQATKRRAVASHEPFSGWFLALLRSALSRGSVRAPIVGGSVPRKRPPLIEAGYRVAMLFTGVITYPLRIYQGSRLAGEGLVVVALRPRE